MSFDKPFHRNYRPVKKGGAQAGYSDWAYIIDKKYAQNPEHYTRAFLIIQEDLLKLFQYVEPSDSNLDTYSFRIHELLMRICIEVEANFKAILKENKYSPKNPTGRLRKEKEWNIRDFKIINRTHHLDDYSIIYPVWNGSTGTRNPFSAWKNPNAGLSWYQAYNKSKHDRLTNFHEANFNNLIDAFAGLCALLSSQFRHVDFQPGKDPMYATGYNYYGGGFGIGDYLIVDYPDNWKESEKYEFDWTQLKNNKVRFEKIDYNKV